MMTADKQKNRLWRVTGLDVATAESGAHVPYGDPLAPPLSAHGNVSLQSAAQSGELAGLRAMAPEIQVPREPVPIWFAVLIASSCQASGSGEDHIVRWNCVSGRALYTNAGPDTEVIEPLGVSLKGGHTVAVSWTPGETTYTVEVFRTFDYCA
jgi:hypothetical protein